MLRITRAIFIFFAAMITIMVSNLSAQTMKSMISTVPDEIWKRMNGRSWHPIAICPNREELSLLNVPYRNFDGNERTGQIIVAKKIAIELAEIFDEIFKSGKFMFYRIDLIDVFEGSDDHSMAANNTSAFNCRLIKGTRQPSAHSEGLAIDINPVQNPMVFKSNIAPLSGKDLSKNSQRIRAANKGMVGLITKGDVVTVAFKKHGWTWGGEWNDKKDYQHFSKNGR